MAQSLSLLVSPGPFKTSLGLMWVAYVGRPHTLLVPVLVTLNSGLGDGMKCKGPARGVRPVSRRGQGPESSLPAGSTRSHPGTWLDGKIMGLVLCSSAPSSGL